MGSRHTEWSTEVVLYGGRESGGFVNSAVNDGTIHLPCIFSSAEVSLVSNSSVMVCRSTNTG